MNMNRALVEFEQRTLTEMRKLERTVLGRMELLHTQLNSKLYFIESKLDALTDGMQQQQQQFVQRRLPFVKRDPNHHRFNHHSANSGANLNTNNTFPGGNNNNNIMPGAQNRIGRRIYCGSGSGELRPSPSNSSFHFYASNNSTVADDAASIEFGPNEPGCGGGAIGGRRASEILPPLQLQQDNGGGGNILIRSFDSCAPMMNNNTTTATPTATPTTARSFNGNENNINGIQFGGAAAPPNGTMTAQQLNNRHSNYSTNRSNNNIIVGIGNGNSEYGSNNGGNGRMDNSISNNNNLGTGSINSNTIMNTNTNNNNNNIDCNINNNNIGIGITTATNINNLQQQQQHHGVQGVQHGVQGVQHGVQGVQHGVQGVQQQQNIMQFARKHSSSSLAEQRLLMDRDHLDLAFHHGSTVSLYAGGNGVRHSAAMLHPLSGNNSANRMPFVPTARAKQRKQHMVNAYFGGFGSALNKLAAANNNFRWTINGVKMMGSNEEVSSSGAAVEQHHHFHHRHGHGHGTNFCPNPSEPLRQTRGTFSHRKQQQWTARSVVGIYTDEEDEEGDDADDDDDVDDGDVSTEGQQTDVEQYKETIDPIKKQHHNSDGKTAANLIGECDQQQQQEQQMQKNFLPLTPTAKCQSNSDANLLASSLSAQNGGGDGGTANKQQQQQQSQQQKQQQQQQHLHHQQHHKHGGATENRANSAENGTRKNFYDYHYSKTAADGAQNRMSSLPSVNNKWSSVRPKRTYGTNGNSLGSTDYGIGTHLNGHLTAPKNEPQNANVNDGKMAIIQKINDSTKKMADNNTTKHGEKVDDGYAADRFQQNDALPAPQGMEENSANLGQNDGNENSANLGQNDGNENSANLGQNDGNENSANLGQNDGNENSANLGQNDGNENSANLGQNDGNENSANLGQNDGNENSANLGQNDGNDFVVGTNSDQKQQQNANNDTEKRDNNGTNVKMEFGTGKAIAADRIRRLSV